MKVLFINPLLGGDYSTLDIAITNLATYINKRTEHKADILDMTFHTKHWEQHLHRGIKAFGPGMVAMSSNTMYMQYINRIAAKVKSKYDLPVILGGYHASVRPNETLKNPHVDAVCIGDGELALTEYIYRIEKGKELRGMDGIWAKEHGRIIRNKIGCFINDIDQLPTPDWNLWKDLKKYFYYLGMLYFIGTRGCPYRCTQCDAHGISKSVKGRYYRIRDPILYAQEIAIQWQKYKKKGMRFAQLFDQVPTLNWKWTRDFTAEYAKQTDVDENKFSMFSRVDNLNENKIRMLSKSGCAILRLGVEAGSPRIRNQVYNKNISNAQIMKIFSLCKKYGVGMTAYYILGGPGETKHTIGQTINLARKLNANRSAFFIFKPFTEESQVLITRYGGCIDEARWKKADNITYDAVVRLKNVSPWQVEWLQKKAYFLTFGKRLGNMLRKDKFKYFNQFSTYMSKGIYDGLDTSYLLPYFHIYGYDWVSK